MKIIFLGTTGVHQALIAANIYLGQLNDNNFKMIKGFGDVAKDKSGFPIFIDEDEKGNQVYTLGAGRDVLIGKKSIEDLVQILGYSSRDLIVKPLCIKGEKIIWLLSKIPDILGGKLWNRYLSKYILKKELNHIRKDVEEFKISLSNN